MTIQGAIADLQYLLEADDVPFYYKGGIEKIIETIQMEMADRKTEPYDDEFEVCDSRNGCYGCEHHICKLEQTEPQRDCFLCKWLGDVDVCGRCRNRNLFAEADTEPKPKTEPQTEREGE